MRKVIFSKWIPAVMETVEGKGYKTAKKGTNCYSEQVFEGSFHCWGSESQEDGDGNYVMDTIAIVEEKDGSIVHVVPNRMRFLS